MSDYKSNPVLVAEILSREGFYNLSGSDGCLCAHLTLRYIAIDVHCWKSNHHFQDYYGKKLKCDCRWAGVHITPTDPEHESELIRIGELVRGEIDRPDMNVKIVIHKAANESQYEGFVEPKRGEKPKVTIISAPEPPEGWEFDDET